MRYGAVRVRATGMFISSFSHMSNRINGRKQYCQILNVRQMGAVSLASEKDFHDIANKTLDDLLERLEAVEESLNNCDISSAVLLDLVTHVQYNAKVARCREYQSW